MRANDVLARVHGDEFMGILYRITPEQAQLWTGRVNEQLQSAGVNICIGTAQLDASDPAASIEKADAEMKAAKEHYYQSNPHLHRRK